jgi:hypothetical protein
MASASSSIPQDSKALANKEVAAPAAIIAIPAVFAA